MQARLSTYSKINYIWVSSCPAISRAAKELVPQHDYMLGFGFAGPVETIVDN